MAFKNFFGLFHFFWDISCLRSLLGCNNPISKLIIIPKGKWFKFLISNHSGIWTIISNLILTCYIALVFARLLSLFVSIFLNTANYLLPRNAVSWHFSLSLVIICGGYCSTSLIALTNFSWDLRVFWFSDFFELLQLA